MIRFLFRLVAVFALAIAVVMAVIDATRTIAAAHVVATPLIDSWQALSPETLAAAEAFTREAMLDELWDPVALTVLSAPGFAVFAILALLAYLIGRKPQRRGRYATVRT